MKEFQKALKYEQDVWVVMSNGLKICVHRQRLRIFK